jgi:hypothetical protein
MYLVFIIFTVIYLLRSWSHKRLNIKEALRLKDVSNVTVLLFVLVVFLIVVNFLIYAFVGTSLNGAGDTMYHLARMVDILGGGFNVQNSYYHTFAESGYHYNVIYSYYVIAAKLFDYIPMKVWRYSLGFFNLMSLLASFSFALFAFTRWVKTKKSSLFLATISMFPIMAFYSYWAFVANNPDRIVKIWEILLIICLSQNITKKNFKPILFMLLGLALITTMSHTLHALIFACFIVVFAFVRLLIQRRDFIKDKLSQLAYALTVIVLMIGPIITKQVPVRVSLKWIENFQPVPHLKIFGFTIIQPTQGTEFIDWVLTASTIIAVVYLIVALRKRKFELAMVLSLIFFFYIFAFTPLCTVLNQFLPLWAISRFNDITAIIGQVYFTIAVFIIFSYISKLIVKKYPNLKKSANYKTILYALFVISIAAPSMIYINNYNRFVFGSNQYVNIDGTVAFVKDYQNILNDNKLVVASDGYDLSALFRIDIISVPYSHDVMASDSLDRLNCQNYIMQHFNYADLAAVGAKYVVATSAEQKSGSLDSKPYLKLLISKKEYYISGYDRVFVYEFINTKKYGNEQVYKPCLEYQQKENE